MNPIWLNAIRASQAAANWWDGLTDVVAVYQPIGAASLAASYVNLVNPGTFDAAPGVAPTWSAATGWGFNGTNQYLTTGVVPTNFSYTILARVSAVNSSRYVIGAANNALTRIVGLAPAFNALGGGRLYANGNFLITSTTVISAGVMAIAGLQPYLNGVPDGGPIASATFDNMNALFIGARNDVGIPDSYFSGNVQAIAICSTTQSAAQTLAASTAMAALT